MAANGSSADPASSRDEAGEAQLCAEPIRADRRSPIADRRSPIADRRSPSAPSAPSACVTVN
jgi:hypothetical protein